MQDKKLRNFLVGSALVSGLSTTIYGCYHQDNISAPQTEITSLPSRPDPYGNIALFERSRSAIKFALSFVENYYPYIYWCGEAWTTGDGLTILYNTDGTCTKVTPETKVPTLAESDIYKGRYLTFEILPDIVDCVTVPMDEKTLIAACVLRYCIGGTNFRKSEFLRQLNAGETGAKLAKTLTGWRQQAGVPNRCYFFAALMADKIKFTDLLDLRAEGCYNLTDKDIFVYFRGHPKRDRQNFYEWDFSKISNNLEKAKNERTVRLNLGRRKGNVRVQCELTKNIVPDYIWQEVSNGVPKYSPDEQNALSANMQNDIAYNAYLSQDYETALSAGKKALELATNNKQHGAACYNIGIAYFALGKYNEAVKYLQSSIAFNKTKVAELALEEAQQKQAANNKNKTKNCIALCGMGCAVAGYLYARKRYLRQKQNTR